MPPVSRRRLLAGTAMVAGLAAAGQVVVPRQADAAVTSDVTTLRSRARTALGTSTTADRPTGSEYVRYEDLYRTGDTVGAALARLGEPKVVTFPEGRFECSDFASGYQAGIAVPAICRGIVGSGRGTLGGSSGTVFTMRPWSSAKGNGSRDSSGRLFVPPQDNSTPCQLAVLKQANQRASATWKNFQVAGTEQGHIFNGFQIYATAGANYVEDVLVTGWSGNAGAPPGETYGLDVAGPGGHVVERVEADGRRQPGGEIFGAMGLTFQNTSGAVFRDCYAHDLRAATYVIYQSVDGYMINCTSDATAPSDKAIGNGGVNLERAAGWTLATPSIIGRPNRIHLTHSNDSWTLNQAGVRKSIANGSLRIVQPAFNDLWGDRLFYLQSWSPYGNGDTQFTAPLMTIHDWATHLPYKWVHQRHQLIT
jgi:hypothetical protein